MASRGRHLLVRLKEDHTTGAGAPRNAPGESPALDSLLANNCPPGAVVASLGSVTENLLAVLIGLYGMIDAVIGTFTVKSLKVLVRTLRRMGFSATVLTGRKADIADSIRRVCMGHLVTLRLTEGAHPPLMDHLVRMWGHYGVLGPVPGARVIVTAADGSRRLVWDEGAILQSGLTPTALDEREWVNTGYDATLEATRGARHTVGRGVMVVGERYTCDLNRDFRDGEAKTPGCATATGIPSCAPGQGSDGHCPDIRPGVCPTCGGPATVPTLRHGISTLNGTFAHAIIIRPDGSIPTKVHRFPLSGNVDALRHPIMAKDCRRDGPSTVWARVAYGPRAWDYEDMAVGEWIGPALRPVHIQKVGGRHAMKVNGRTQWVSGSFVRIIYPSESFGDLLVWAFVCNSDPLDRTRHPAYNPARLNRAALAVARAGVRAGLHGAPAVLEGLEAEWDSQKAARRSGGAI